MSERGLTVEVENEEVHCCVNTSKVHIQKLFMWNLPGIRLMADYVDAARGFDLVWAKIFSQTLPCAKVPACFFVFIFYLCTLAGLKE